MGSLQLLDASPTNAAQPVVVDAEAELTEGPIWDSQRQRLLWVDISRGLVHGLDVETGTMSVWRVGHEVGAVAPRAAGGYEQRDAQPLAGAISRCRTGVHGLATPSYGG
jgi:sugar lactone lactonase YvrE